MADDPRPAGHLRVTNPSELSYEFEQPFVLDTTRFETKFGACGTPLAAAVAETVAWYQNETRAQ